MDYLKNKESTSVLELGYGCGRITRLRRLVKIS